jgi:Leucine-rich repeat (LRR) protein
MALPSFPQDRILSGAELAAYPTYTRIQKTPVDSVFKMCLENIHEIPADFDKWKRLQQLCIFGNDWDYDLFQLPGYFYDFPNLTYLCIANTDIATLSTSIKNFTNLETLNVANNQLVSLPKTITTLPNLKELTIDNNIDKIPEIASLEALNIYFETNLGDDSGTIPQGIGSLAKVKHLYLNSENTFINIPQMISTIKMLPSLETLSFMDPNMEEMDIRELTGIKKIKELNLPSVLADPDVFAGFSHLQRFSFGKYLEPNPKKREQFWNTLAGFKNLQEVSATFNIADTQYYRQFKNINIVLNLDGKLDDQIAALKNTPGLKCLTFPRSSVIPRVLSEMKTLREVDVTELYGVDISFIFGYLMTIPTLEKITISNDQFTKFPQETVKLANLKEMVVYNIQHGGFNAITQKEKERAQKLLPNCKFTYIETF